MSAQPLQQLVVPMTIPVLRQGRPQVANVPSVPNRGRVLDSDHEINMIENLRNHIRDSLMGIPDDLPELKGLHMKLPNSYGGDDKFDKLDNWLQSLLRYFKIHQITRMDKD